MQSDPRDISYAKLGPGSDRVTRWGKRCFAPGWACDRYRAAGQHDPSCGRCGHL